MKKISLVLLAAVGLTACNQTTKLPPSHYDKLADQPYIESYPLLADVSLLKAGVAVRAGGAGLSVGSACAEYVRHEGKFGKGLWQRL